VIEMRLDWAGSEIAAGSGIAQDRKEGVIGHRDARLAGCR
jgi:hypothetical protein